MRNLFALLSLLISGSVYAQVPEPNGAPQSFQAYVTGYSYWDNTPPGTVEISHPMRHPHAGGMGTFSNPITMAVGHQIINGEDILDIPPGTVFYLPRLRKYAIVEDSCGDGPTPQDGPCHIGKDGLVWLDIFVGGASLKQTASDACMRDITGAQPVILDPGPNLSVVVGPLTESGCFVFPDP